MVCPPLVCPPAAPPLQGLLAKEDLHVNMCDALANLPTSQGLEALDTFERRAASEDVRNKTGFMVRAVPAGFLPWNGAARCAHCWEVTELS